MHYLPVPRALLAVAGFVAVLTIQFSGLAVEAANSDISEFSRFAPRESSVFLVVRPKQLVDSQLWQQLSQLKPIREAAISAVDVELLAVAITAKDAFGPFLPSEQERVFAAIAANLDGAAIVEEEIDRHVPRCAILLRCSRAVASEEISDLLARMLPAPSSRQQFNFRSAQWNGREILRSDVRDSPVAMRVDDRTFVFADQESFSKGTRSGLGGTQTASKGLQYEAIWQEIAAAGSTDFAVTVDAGRLVAMAKNESLPIPEFLQQSVSAAVSISLSTGDLISAEFEFTDAESADQLRTAIDMFHQLAILQAPALLEQQTQQPGHELELSDTLLPIIKSLETSADGRTVSLRLPRPANWDKVIDRMVRLARDKQAGETRLSEIRTKDFSGKVPTTRVPVYAGRLKAGEQLIEPYVTVGIWPTEDLPEGVILSREELIGATTSRRVDAHMPIVKDDIKTRGTH